MTDPGSWLRSSGPLVPAHDLVMLDLDGVVYVGPDAVPGAPSHLARARDAGAHLAFVTNNAARPPGAVAAHLCELGVPTDVAEVVTSAQAAATVAVELVGRGARAYVMGGPGVAEALEQAGLRPTPDTEPRPDVVVSGYGPDLPWRAIMAGAVLVRDGVPWVASNTDRTVPLPGGPGPGHGVLVEMVRGFAEVDPHVAGKPEPPLLQETVRRVGGRHPLMVGDRLDTDVLGATRAGVPSLLVRTGVTTLRDLVGAPPDQRPTYLSADLAGLLDPHPAVERHPERAEATCRGARAHVRDGHLEVTGDAVADDWWRAAAAAAWDHLDRTGDVAAAHDLRPPAEGVA